jgi:hypothetical protein
MTNAPAPDLSVDDLVVLVAALRKAARMSHPIMAMRERELAYRLAKLIPPPFTPEEVES